MLNGLVSVLDIGSGYKMPRTARQSLVLRPRILRFKQNALRPLYLEGRSAAAFAEMIDAPGRTPRDRNELTRQHSSTETVLGRYVQLLSRFRSKEPIIEGDQQSSPFSILVQRPH